MYFSTLVLFICCCCSATYLTAQSDYDFEIPPNEKNCFQYFDEDAEGVHPVNTFLLAKMTEMMYLERLDYQLRYLQNGCKAVDTIPSSDWIKENCAISDSTFEASFVKRFGHFFDPLLEQKAKHEQHVAEGDITPHTQFKYIQKTYTQEGRFFGFKYKSGLDPELMVISTPTAIFILFRGTDDVGKSQWAEWIGTDFRINQMKAGGALVGTKVHTGFWLSFELIRDQLVTTLAEFDAKNKKIWLAGHSLGAALSVVTGVYLKSYGLDVQNVYAYACPRTIGNKAFIKRCDEILPNGIQRFEYFQDPVTMIWAPGYKYHHVGKRNWYDEEEKGNYQLYQATEERTFISKPTPKYTNIQVEDRKEANRIKRNQMNGSILVGTKMLHYHNPQWYVKAAHAQLTAEQKAKLPAVDDSFPYLYFGRDGCK